jgi:hypothetical protein
MPPDLLEEVVRGEVESCVDEEALARIRAREEEDRREIESLLDEALPDER